MPDPAARETQVDAALRALEKARGMGWSKVTIEVTRGGTLRIDAADADGAKVARPQFSTGLRK